MRGIKNPVAVKIGPTMDPKHLIALANLLNPDNEPGRLTFIHRMGAKKIDELLPPLIETIKKANLTVVWSCDPMHGNTTTTQQGIKTRHFEDILSELQQSFAIHKRLGTHLGGVHFEMTGDDVTECLGGARGLTEHDLSQAYKSLVDPRLNYEQALEIALSVVKGFSHSPFTEKTSVFGQTETTMFARLLMYSLYTAIARSLFRLILPQT
jgi:3-deoxy-7-phosphoheptulonate synthase